MYNVSQDYKDDMLNPVQKFALSGTVGGVEFDESNILTGTFQITNQNSDDGKLTVGSTYIGQLTATFLGMDSIPRYAWRGKTIHVEHIRLMDEAEDEGVPLGVFVVAEAIRTEEGISVTAYDYMTRFDKDLSFSTSSGKPYAFLNYFCQQCDVGLGMTAAQVAELQNGNTSMVMPTDTGMETFRDALSQLAAALGCYATINREGELVLRDLSPRLGDQIDDEHRFRGGTYEDFVTRFTAVKLTYAKDKTVIYQHFTPDNGLTLDLGANPFLQFRNKVHAQEAVWNILNSLRDVAYVPYTMQMIGDPAYDLGDCLEFIGGRGDQHKTFCINRYTYTYNGPYEIVGVGEDPTVNAKSKTDKALAAAISQNQQNTIQYYRYINLKKYTVGAEDVAIIDIHFTAMQDVVAVFEAEILCDVETSSEAIATIKYIMNNEEITDYHPVETWIDGKHVLHLLYFIDCVALQLTHWQVRMNLTGGTASIGINQIRAVISGQGLMEVESWDGLIYAEDIIGASDVERELELVSFADDADLDIVADVILSATDNMDAVALEKEPDDMDGITDTAYINKKPLRLYTWGQVLDYTWQQLLDDFVW